METPTKSNDVIEFIFALMHEDPEKGPDIVRSLQAKGLLAQAAKEYCEQSKQNGGGAV